jgi:protein-S-isoprenylcysteine O-methyltransferase Ste14
MGETGFWSLLLAVAVFGGIHSWTASMGLKKRFALRCKDNFERFYRLFYNGVAAVTLLLVLVLVVILPDRFLYRIPAPWIWLTLILQGIALWGMAVSMGRSGTARFLGIDQALGRNSSEHTDELVVDGLYRWVRHPIYLFSLVFIWLMPEMSMNILGLNLGLTLYLFIGTWFEEKKLEAAFGETYTRYKQKTPMFFPFRLQSRK